VAENSFLRGIIIDRSTTASMAYRGTHSLADSDCELLLHIPRRKRKNWSCKRGLIRGGVLACEITCNAVVTQRELQSLLLPSSARAVCVKVKYPRCPEVINPKAS
jgi:hypothetical protein